MKYLESVVKMPLMDLPVRSVVIEVGSSRLLISPGSRLTPDQIKSAGPMTDIIGNSLLHTAGVPQAMKLFPTARVWGPPGVRDKKPEIAWTHELNEAQWSFQNQVPMVFVEGMPSINEVVFIHDRTLIVADLCFNLTDAKGLGAWIILSLFGTYRKFGVSKLFLRYLKNREACTNSVKKIMDCDFDRIVPSHGSVIEAGGKELLRRAFNERGILV